MSHFITGLDIGSKNIKIVVAEKVKGDRLVLRGVFKTPTEGMRKGEIINFEDATASVKNALNEVKNVSPSAIKNIFVNLGGCNVRTQTSRGIIAVSRPDNEIHQDDVERVTRASCAINLPANRAIIHTVAREFIVDNVKDIRNPLEMVGTRLEVDSLVVDAFSPTIKNVSRCIEVAGGSVSGMIYGPFAAARSVLSKNQKDLGVILIDIGFGTTGMVVYEEDKIAHAATFPVGAGNITNDLAIGLKTSIKNAEAIKLLFGYALAKEISPKEKIDLSQIDGNLKSAVSRRFVSEIIEVRLAEIFEFINNELKLIGKSGQLPAGAVLVGGGIKMPGIVELAKQELRLPAQVGIPQTDELELLNADFADKVEDPEFANVIGLIYWAEDQDMKSGGWSPIKIKRISLPNVFRYFLP